MVNTDYHLRDVEEQTLAIVRKANRPYPSGEVIRQLSEQGVPGPDIRIALWYLVDRSAVGLTMDWQLIAHDREQRENVDTTPVASGG